MDQSDCQANIPKAISKKLFDMHHYTTQCSEFNRMKRSVSPFLNYFGLNHFYYMRILPSGDYTTLGTLTELHEFTFDNPKMFCDFPYIRHPKHLKPGIFIGKNSCSKKYTSALNDIFNKFKTKPTINIWRNNNEAFEVFGFRTKNQADAVVNLMINDIFLVYKFIDYFVSENSCLIRKSHECQVNMIPLVGDRFNKKENLFLNIHDKTKTLQQMGIENGEFLTNREREILQLLKKGYSARYIAGKLFISARTVENYIANMKLKLNCNKKTDLINIANNYFF